MTSSTIDYFESLEISWVLELAMPLTTKKPVRILIELVSVDQFREYCYFENIKPSDLSASNNVEDISWCLFAFA